MRIAEIHLFQVDLPVGGAGYRMSEGTHTSLDSAVAAAEVDCHEPVFITRHAQSDWRGPRLTADVASLTASNIIAVVRGGHQ